MLLGLGVSAFVFSLYLMSTPMIPDDPSGRSRPIAASNTLRLLRYAGSSHPGEWAKRISPTFPGASGHQACTARAARPRLLANSPKRLNAIAGDHRRSAHIRW